MIKKGVDLFLPGGYGQPDSGKPGVEPVPDVRLLFLVEPRDIILVVVDPGADGERDAGSIGPRKE
jgi:hypothetical protein